jgi:CrcB protein
MTQRHPLAHLEAILSVGIGGFAGANLRYFVDLTVPSTLVTTATVNILGCLALGLLFYEEQFTGQISQSSQTVLVTGFLASFTTYSTFVLDAVTTTPAIGLVYLGGSYTLGFLGVLIGRALARTVAASYEGRR